MGVNSAYAYPPPRDGAELVRSLAQDADIVLENYKCGTLVRYGLDEASLRKVNPRLIYCSVTGFGQTGPRRDQVAYDFLIQAMGGLMSVTGERDGRPGGGPQKVGVPIVDLMTGMYTAVAVLAALARRNECGRGDYIDIGMLDVQVATLANQAMNFLATGTAPRKMGNAHPNLAPYAVFDCADGWIILATGNDAQYRRLCTLLRLPGMVAAPEFASNADRIANRAAMTEGLAAATRHWSKADLLAACEAEGVPAGPINDLAEVFADPQIIHRGLQITVQGVPGVRSPFTFSDATLALDRPAPKLGEHQAEVLG
jgi:crotonobetainyl-CoA:carnitine CoA-transferase CaiB-like acyl-CoA transferase